MVQDAPAVVKVQQIYGAGGMDLYLAENTLANTFVSINCLSEY